MKISVGLIEEFADIERNGDSFCVHVNKHVERKRDAKKENESNVESRCASGHEDARQYFWYQYLRTRSRLYLPTCEIMQGYTRCTSLPIALNHDLHHGCRSDSAEFCPPPRSRSAEIDLVIPRLLLPNPYRLIFKYTFYTFSRQLFRLSF